VQVTWNLSGSVTNIGIYSAELSSLGVAVGTPFTASYTFDSETPELEPPEAIFDGIYPGAVLEATFDAGEYSVSYSPPVENEIWAPYQGDRLAFRGETGGPRSLADPYLALVFWYDVAGNGPTLPIAPPVDGGYWEFFVITADIGNYSIASTDFTVTYTVPEAGASAGLTLFAAALAARTAGRRLRASRL
jgi:hypothetical protein